MKRSLLFLSILLLLSCILTNCTREKGGEPKGISVGMQAPDFSLEDISGSQVSLKDFQGKILLINFWATWCYPCREEMDDLQRVYDQYRDMGVVIIGIDMKEGREVVKKFTDSMNITYPILLDTDGQTSEAYNIFGVPSSYFVDREGIIQDIVLGEMKEDSIISKIEKLM